MVRSRLRYEMNPIVVKELRSRMRGGRAFAVLTGVLLLLGLVSFLLYRMVMATSVYTSFPLSPQVGQVLFVGLAMVELLLICFVAPAVTAGAISGEQEKLTYEMLLTTPLRPASILWGKLIATLGYIFLLIFAAVPMASLVFIFGGVSVWDMTKALTLLLLVAVTLGIAGIFFSAWLGRTTRAMVATYLLVLALLAGPVFAYIFVGVLTQQLPPGWLLIPNPVSALFSALAPVQYGGGPTELLWGLARFLGGNADPSNPNPAGLVRPLYHYTLVFYAGLSLILYLLSTRLVQPVRRWHIGRKGALVALALLLLFGGVVAAGYFATTARYEGARGPGTPTPAPIIMPFSGVREAVPMPAPAINMPPPAPAPTVTPIEIDLKAGPTPTPTPWLDTATPLPPPTTTPRPSPEGEGRAP